MAGVVDELLCAVLVARGGLMRECVGRAAEALGYACLGLGGLAVGDVHDVEVAGVSAGPVAGAGAVAALAAPGEARLRHRCCTTHRRNPHQACDSQTPRQRSRHGRDGAAGAAQCRLV